MCNDGDVQNMLLIKQMSQEHAVGREGLLICRGTCNDGGASQCFAAEINPQIRQARWPHCIHKHSSSIMHGLIN